MHTMVCCSTINRNELLITDDNLDGSAQNYTESKNKKNKKQKTKTDEQKTVSKDSIIYIPFV